MLGVGEDLTFLGNPFLPETTAKDLGQPFGIGWALMVPATLAGLTAVRVRWRAAQGEARDQLWLLQRAALVVTLGFVACLIGSLVAPAAFDVGAVTALISLTVLAATMAWRSCATGSTASTSTSTARLCCRA